MYYFVVTKPAGERDWFIESDLICLGLALFAQAEFGYQ